MELHERPPPSGSDSSSDPIRRIVAIGNFDGVHRGHRQVLEHTVEEARRRDLIPSVLTFSPHPLSVLGRPVPPALTKLRRKIELIARVSHAIEPIVERFDAEFAAQSPEAFARDVLASQLGAKVVVVGQNFRFGRGRAGGFDTLSSLGEKLGFSTRSHALAGDEGGPWSSSRVRAAIAAGELAEASRILGRPHMISGSVIKGDQRGRTIGFPTCNLAGVEEALPPFGVYAVLVDREDGEGRATALAKGVANVGVRPTVKDASAAPSVEVHLFDVAMDLYGARLRVHVIERLRAERRFDGLDALKAQIARDAEAAREALRDAMPDASNAYG